MTTTTATIVLLCNSYEMTDILPIFPSQRRHNDNLVSYNTIYLKISIENYTWSQRIRFFSNHIF